MFWTGDVLHMYALFGLVLLALRRVPDKVILVPLSSLWLARFALGPMEYLWRVLTYGRSTRGVRLRSGLSSASAE